MARAASATARGIFSWGTPRRRGLWWPWPGEENHLQLAQLQQVGGHPAGKVQAVLLPIHQPLVAGEELHLFYVSFSVTYLLSVVWFGWQQPQLLRNFMISQFNQSLYFKTWFLSTFTLPLILRVVFLHPHGKVKIRLFQSFSETIGAYFALQFKMLWLQSKL